MYTFSITGFQQNIFVAINVFIFVDNRTIETTRIIELPRYLVFVSKHSTGSNCCSVSHSMDGDIWLSTYSELKILNQNKTLTTYDGNLGFLSVCVNYQIFTIREEKTTAYVEMYFPGVFIKERLFQFQKNSNLVPFIAVSDSYIAVTNPSSCHLYLYNLFAKKKMKFKLEPALWAIHFLSNGDLLATAGEDELGSCRTPKVDNSDSNILIKYRIKDGNLSKVWICQDLPYACGVCTDSDGLIYVSAFRNKKIYVVSPSGQFLNSSSAESLFVFSSIYHTLAITCLRLGFADVQT